MLAPRLDGLANEGLLDPDELASAVKAEAYDVRAVLSKAAEAGILLETEHVRCPNCQTPMRATLWRKAVDLDGVAECTACGTCLPDPSTSEVRWELAPTTVDAIRQRLVRPLSALVLCALDLERDAVIAHLADVKWQIRDEARYAVGTVAGNAAQWIVSVGVSGALPSSAAVSAASAIAAERPDIAIFVGIAGGRKDVKRGDVVIADQLADVSGGKETDGGLLVRLDPYRPSHKGLEAARQVVSQGIWQARIEKLSPDGSEPHARIDPIAASTRVIASDDGEIAKAIGTHFDRAVAVEMEGSGFLTALHRRADVDALVVRGISDLRTDKQDSTDRDWQSVAADHAAAFALEVLRIW